MSHLPHASRSCSHDTTASAAEVWAFFQAVPEWKNWNAGVHACSLDGPFAVGTWMTMVMPDQEIIKSQLVEVDAPHAFTDETRLGDITVRVRHEVSALPDRKHRITYAIDVVGDGASDICAGVSADFPEVLQALVAKLENRTTQ